MKTIEKASIPLFLNDTNEPAGLIYYNKNKERVIYIVHKTSEEEIINLFNNNDRKI